MKFPKPVKQVKEKKRTPRKGKSERKRLIDSLDDVVRQICRKRDERCASCGKVLSKGAQVSHYIGRRYFALRWDLRNCHMSCAGCNILHNTNPAPYTNFMIITYGESIFDELEFILQAHTKFGILELRELLENLKQN